MGFSEQELIRKNCTGCGVCQEECEFLERFGTPRDIASSRAIQEQELHDLAFLCSLCGLCTAVCPKAVDPKAFFLELRRIAVRKGRGRLSSFGPLRRYEAIGKSRLLRFADIPYGSRRVFFPGCSLPGTRPERVSDLFVFLRGIYSDLGMVLDCCSKPSHDLGNHALFLRRFNSLREGLVSQGIEEVLVACPNCFKVFRQYGSPLKVRTVYEVMRERVQGGRPVMPEPDRERVFTIHDPCSVRFEKGIHRSVRDIVRRLGFFVEEMPHSRRLTYCCGEGGAIGYTGRAGREFANGWSGRRREEAGRSPVITYCAGCANYLQPGLEVYHVLDLVFDADNTLSGRFSPSKSPMTYLNRAMLKFRLRDTGFSSVNCTSPRNDQP